MAFTSRTRLVNPRLGTYFGIFTSGFAAVFLLALIFELLGASDGVLRALMFFGPVLLYFGIGAFVPVRSLGDFFASGRRVPAFFNGAGLAASALGGTALLAITGTLMIAGVDAFAMTLGWTAGLVFMGVLFIPFLRKFGAYTLPSYFARRFESRVVRLTAAAILVVPLLLVIIAEARFAAYAAGWLLGQSERWMAVLLMACVTAILILGGLRAISWTGVAMCIVLLLALAVPASVTATLQSKLPIPQMTHGNALVPMSRAEAARGVPFVVAPALNVDLPSSTHEPLIKRFIQPFGNVGSFGFVLLSLVCACGIASSPALLARAGTSPGVYEARKSAGWAVLIVGLVMMTLPAIVVYYRARILDLVVGHATDSLPEWFTLLQQAGIARIETKTQLLLLSQIHFERDATLFSQPIAMGYPQVLVYLALAGALAAALAALATTLMSAASILSEDVVVPQLDDEAPDAARLFIARLTILATGFVAMCIIVVAPGDPLELMLWALNILASASFPVLFLSIWWKRTNAWGALIGMVTGFSLAIFLILLGEAGIIRLPSLIAAAVAAPCAMLAATVTTLLTPVPARSVVDVVREIRVPGGETIYDREARLARLRVRAKA